MPALASVPGLGALVAAGILWAADRGQLRQRARGGRRPGGHRLRSSSCRCWSSSASPRSCSARAGRLRSSPLRAQDLSLSAINGAAALDALGDARRRMRLDRRAPGRAIPGRNVPRATLIGTFIVGLIYILVSTAGRAAAAAGRGRAGRTAPIALFVSHYWSPGLGLVVGLFAAMSAIGALERLRPAPGRAAAGHGARRRLPRLVRQDHAGPAFRSAPRSSPACSRRLLIAANYSRSLAGLFTFMILLATSATLVLYLACALAALRLQQTRTLPVSAGLTAVAALGRTLFGLDSLRRRLRRAQMGRGAARDRHPGLCGDAAHRPLQPGGGGESSRVSGMSRLSFLAKLRRQTSLLPSGPGV